MLIRNDGGNMCVELDAGETSPPIFMAQHDEAVVVATPDPGGSMTVSASWSLVSQIQAGAGDWQIWDQGTVTVGTSQTLYKATALRATATTTAGTLDVRQ